MSEPRESETHATRPRGVTTLEIIGPELHREAECEAVLRSLPQWFGIESSLLEYAADSGRLPTFALVDAQRVCGFISLEEHFPESWEVHCIAVSAALRGCGGGTRLLQHAEAWLASKGVRLVQIKTIAATHENPHYAETRAFYARRGYLRVEVFPELWHPRNPALQLVKSLEVS